jgi:hypothetical protein
MQSVRQSLIETACSTAFGFVLSLLWQHYGVNPLWRLHASPFDSIGITISFTVLSLVRQFYTRRFFNWLHNRNKK